MKLFKTRTGMLPLFLLVVSFGTAALLKPWWDRIRGLAPRDLLPVPEPTKTPASWPASRASTWTVDPQSKVPEITRTEIKSPATSAGMTKHRIRSPRHSGSHNDQQLSRALDALQAHRS
jgi:hypothetical protein